MLFRPKTLEPGKHLSEGNVAIVSTFSSLPEGFLGLANVRDRRAP